MKIAHFHTIQEAGDCALPGYGKMNYPARKAQFLRDAAEVADLIFDTLRFREGLRFNDLWRLCEEHGCRPIITATPIPQKWGLFYDCRDEITDFSDGGHIFLSENLTFTQACGVMVHELTHRILYTPRFADWLEEEREHLHYDRHEWQEAVCRAVERRFMEAGGVSLLPPRY